jgi:hypothetical protein
MPENEAVPTIHEALAAVMAEVQSIGKDSTNVQQNYRFRGVDAVVNAVGPAFRNNRVICLPISAEHSSEHYTTKGGANMRGVTVIAGFRFYGPAGDYIDAQVSGEASDAGDKATPKAHSVAYRTMLLQALCIPTGDPDPDSESHERAPRREEGPQPYPVPKSWPAIQKAVERADNPEEAWLLFKAFARACVYHLFGVQLAPELVFSKPSKDEAAMLTTDQWSVLGQKAAGAAVWLHENVKAVGPDALFFDEAEQRKAWAHVLEGALLEIPDYVPPEQPAEATDMDEAAQRAAEAESDYS